MTGLRIVWVATLGLLLATGASAQNVKGGEHGLKGTLVTGTCTAAPGTTCAVLTAPENGGLVVTTGCITQVGGGGHFGYVLNGQPLSFGCLSTIGGPAPPSSLAVGYVVDPGTSFECTNPVGATIDLTCTVSGVLTKK